MDIYSYVCQFLICKPKKKHRDGNANKPVISLERHALDDLSRNEIKQNDGIMCVK